MDGREQRICANRLPLLLLAYGAVSLLHRVHNAVFLDEYPNMPAWLTPAKVDAALLGVALLGLAGYALMRRGYQVAGLAVIALFGVLGLAGREHYALAPWAAHSAAMNLTIGLEVAGAVCVLIAVATAQLKRRRQAGSRVRQSGKHGGVALHPVRPEEMSNPAHGAGN